MPTITLTAELVATAKCPEGKDREIFWDAKKPGFGLMVTANGAKSYVVQYRSPTDGASRRMTINGGLALAKAKNEAEIIIGDVAKGKDPLADKRRKREASADTLRRIVEDEYLAAPDVKKLRSADDKRRTFERYIFPALGKRPIGEIKRSEIVRMLARVKERNGPAAANNTYKELNRFFNWHAPRVDDFRSPIVRGTFSQSKGDGARTLTDDEIRIVWNVAGEGKNPYDHLLRFILLTATRLNESARMIRPELSADATEWTIPEARYKGEDGKSAHAHLIPLSPLARDVLAGIPVIQIKDKPSDWIFTTNGKSPISGFSKFKVAFDKRVNAALQKEGDATRERIVAALNDRYPGKRFEPFGAEWYRKPTAEREPHNPWSTHSLRKSARTLMDRIGISEPIAEKCLGHIRGGIVGVYNHHEAKPEKRAAFEALAREVERIASGETAKIIDLAAARVS